MNTTTRHTNTVATIVFVDGMKGGHHTTDVCLHTRAALELGYRTIVCCAEPEAVQAWVNDNCPAMRQHCRIFAYADPPPSQYHVQRLRATLEVWARWNSTVKAIKTVVAQTQWQPDLVFFNYLDGYLSLGLMSAWIDRLMPYRWTGLYFSSSYQRFGISRPQLRRGPAHPFAGLRSRHCHAVAALDEGGAEALAHMIGKPVIPFPDPQDDTAPDRSFAPAIAAKQAAAGRPIIGVVGSLAQRKGVAALAQVAHRCAERGWFFLFAGHLVRNTFSKAELHVIDELIASEPKHCYFYLKHIPDQAQFNALIAACDIVYAAYENFLPSSGLLTKAALFDKPVIVSKGYCMAERVQRFGMGATMYQGNVAQCIEAIEFLTDPVRRQAIALDFAGYRNEHSPEQLKRVLKRIMEYDE